MQNFNSLDNWNGYFYQCVKELRVSSIVETIFHILVCRSFIKHSFILVIYVTEEQQQRS